MVDIFLRPAGADPQNYDPLLPDGAGNALVGAVTTTAIPAATLDYKHTAAQVGGGGGYVVREMYFRPTAKRNIVGSVTITTVPTAVLGFTRHAGLMGAATVSVRPTAAMAATRHRAIVGAVEHRWRPTAAMSYADRRPLPFVVARSVGNVIPFRVRRSEDPPVKAWRVKA